MIFAYSPFVRALFWLAYRYLVTFFVTQTTLYDNVYLSLDWGTASLTNKVEEKVRKLKADAKVRKRAQIDQKLWEEKKKWEETMNQEKEEKRKQEDKRAGSGTNEGQPPNSQVENAGRSTQNGANGSTYARAATEKNASPRLRRKPTDIEAGITENHPQFPSPLTSPRPINLEHLHTTPPEIGRMAHGPPNRPWQ